MNEAGRVDRMENASLLFTAGTHSSIIVEHCIRPPANYTVANR